MQPFTAESYIEGFVEGAINACLLLGRKSKNYIIPRVIQLLEDNPYLEKRHWGVYRDKIELTHFIERLIDEYPF